MRCRRRRRCQYPGPSSGLQIQGKGRPLRIPILEKMGIGNILPLNGVDSTPSPLAYYSAMREAGSGKDTMTGHWEMMGLRTTKPFQTFTEHGFPEELIRELEKRTGRKIIGNKSASGTEILEELGEEEVNEGHLIVYTSADSVLQICGNEETMGLEEPVPLLRDRQGADHAGGMDGGQSDRPPLCRQKKRRVQTHGKSSRLCGEAFSENGSGCAEGGSPVM